MLHFINQTLVILTVILLYDFSVRNKLPAVYFSLLLQILESILLIKYTNTRTGFQVLFKCLESVVNVEVSIFLNTSLNILFDVIKKMYSTIL